jgi:hypothetical protein
MEEKEEEEDGGKKIISFWTSAWCLLGPSPTRIPVLR